MTTFLFSKGCLKSSTKFFGKCVDKLENQNILLMEMRERGLTLIEIMVIVVILGVLAGISIPAYRQHTLRTKLKTTREDIISTFRLA